MTSSILKLLPLLGVALPILLLMGEAQEASAQRTVVSGPFVGPSVKGVSFNGDLRKLPQVKPSLNSMRLHSDPIKQQGPQIQRATPFKDPVRQAPRAPQSMPSPIQNFIGLDRASWGTQIPPDPVGDIGPNHYIQAVNTSIGIYSKTGTPLAAFTFNTFWSGAGTGTYCDNTNQGDPIILYDSQADRWVIADIGGDNTPNGSQPFYECIAVSKSGDPISGGWWLYALLADLSQFNDYGKLGVWSDAYYMSANMLQPENNYNLTKIRVWALDRTAMLSGTLNSVSFDLTCGSPCYKFLLPSNARGTPPPAGTPNFFASILGPNNFHLWKFHVDWTTPANSTFTGPTTLAVANYSNFSSTIPESGGMGLFALSDDRLMMQLQYRNIGGTESLWANHTVQSNGVAGIRWYEIRNPNGTPTIAQQGTYQPDSNYRWTGSLAADGNGNMAIGYSMSSTTTVPSIVYAGRLTTDTLGTLGQGEATLFAGTGAQMTHSAWGDYSAMSVDPVDDCTFWYTNEYYTSTTPADNWQTRIGAFKFPSCNPTPYPTNHTITFDGVVNPNIEWNPNSDKLGTMGGIDYYVTWDVNNLYVAIAGGSLSTNAFALVVDTDSTNRTSSNTGSSNPLACAGFNGNGKGDFALTRGAGSTTKYQASGGAWAATWTPSASTDAKDNASTNVEFQLKWTDVGLPPISSTVGLYLYVCNGTSLVSAWPPENLQSGTNPILNVETSFAANDSGRIPRTFGRHIGDEQLSISVGGSFSFLNGYVQLANVSGLSGGCNFDASVLGNADTGEPNIIRRTYTLTPSGCTNVVGDLTLKYEDGTMPNNAPDELAGLTEPNLALVRRFGALWMNMGGSDNASANTVAATRVSQFSTWSMGVANSYIYFPLIAK